MRTKFFLLALAFLIGVSANTQAQSQSQPSQPEASDVAADEEVPANVPSMVVREAPMQTRAAAEQPVQHKADKQDKHSTTKKDLAQATATASVGRYAAKPIVFSAQAPGLTPEVAMDATTGNPDYDRMVMESAARNQVDPNLILAVMRQESGFNPHSRSYKGACGLMQLMPETARRFGVTNIYDAAQNIEGGAKYLRFLLDKFDGDVSLALAGYNAGEMAVVGAGYRIPRYRETQNYVRSISARYGSQGKMEVPRDPKAPPKLPGAMVMAEGAGSVLSNNY